MKLNSKYYVVSEKSADDKRLLAFDDGKVMFPKRGTEGITTGICHVSYKQDKGKYIVFNGKMVEPERVTYEQVKQFCEENNIVPNGTFETNAHNILIMYGMKGASDEFNPTYPLISVNGKVYLVNWSATLTTAERTRVDFSDRYNAELSEKLYEDLTAEDIMDAGVRNYSSEMKIQVFGNKVITIDGDYNCKKFVKISGIVVEDKHAVVKGEVTREMEASDVRAFMEDKHICAGYKDAEPAIIVKDIYFNNLKQIVKVFNGRAWNSSMVTVEEIQEVEDSYKKFTEFKRSCGRHVTKSSVFQLRDLSDAKLLAFE